MFICTYTYVRNATRRMTDVAGKLSRLLWTHAHVSCWSELCVYILSWPEGASEVIDSIPTQRYLGHPPSRPPPHAICTAVASSRIVPQPAHLKTCYFLSCVMCIYVFAYGHTNMFLDSCQKEHLNVQMQTVVRLASAGMHC